MECFIIWFNYLASRQIGIFLKIRLFIGFVGRLVSMDTVDPNQKHDHKKRDPQQERWETNCEHRRMAHWKQGERERNGV